MVGAAVTHILYDTFVRGAVVFLHAAVPGGGSRVNVLGRVKQPGCIPTKKKLRLPNDVAGAKEERKSFRNR